jgi:hypothetical protein
MTSEKYEELKKLKNSLINNMLVRIIGFKRSGQAHGAEATKSQYVGKIVPIIKIVPSVSAVLVKLEHALIKEHYFHYSEIETPKMPHQSINTDPLKIEYDFNSYEKFFTDFLILR